MEFGRVGSLVARRKRLLESPAALAAEIGVQGIPVAHRSSLWRTRIRGRRVHFIVRRSPERIEIALGVIARHRHVRFRVEQRYIRGHVGLEIKRSRCLRLAERFAYGSHENLAYSLFVLEFYFVFLRVDIDIDCRRFHLEINEIRRLRIRLHELLVALNHGAMEKRVAHIAAVDKEKLVVASFLGKARHAHEA